MIWDSSGSAALNLAKVLLWRAHRVHRLVILKVQVSQDLLISHHRNDISVIPRRRPPSLDQHIRGCRMFIGHLGFRGKLPAVTPTDHWMVLNGRWQQRALERPRISIYFLVAVHCSDHYGLILWSLGISPKYESDSRYIIKHRLNFWRFLKFGKGCPGVECYQPGVELLSYN